MKFGLHNPSWLFDSDPAEIFPCVRRSLAIGALAECSPMWQERKTMPAKEP
jgi:hypothetical protein